MPTAMRLLKGITLVGEEGVWGGAGVGGSMAHSLTPGMQTMGAINEYDHPKPLPWKIMEHLRSITIIALQCHSCMC